MRNLIRSPLLLPVVFFAVVIFIERLPFDSEMIIREMTIDKFAGKTLRSIDLTNRFNVQAIAIKKNRESSFEYIPKADDKLNQDDKIVVIGSVKALSGIRA